MRWHSAGSVPAASRRAPRAARSNGDSPVSSASNAGSREQVQGERQPVGEACGSARRAGETVPTWLPRMRQPAGVERAAQRQADLAVAVPAQLDDRALRREQVQRPAAARPRWRWRGRPGRARRRRRRAARTRRRAPRRPPARPGSTSTSWTCDAGEPGQQRARRSSPTMPAPTTVTRSPTSGAASHSAFTAVSTVPASTARAGGTPSGTATTALAGTTYAVWCG